MSKNLPIIKFLEIICFLIPFTLLLVNNSNLFPFITGKALTFRILITITILPIAYLLLNFENIVTKKDLLVFGLVCYFLSYILGTIFSVNPFRSFWGNAERMEGLWSMFFYLFYPIFLLVLFRFKPEAKKTIFISFLIVSFFISLLAILQKLQNPLDRPVSTLGNATYIGFFNVLIIFLTIAFLIIEKNSFLKIIYIFLIILNLASLLSSETRGSILAFIGGITALSTYFILILRNKVLKISLLLAVILIYSLGFLFLKTNIALEIPGIRRIAESLQNPNTYMARIIAWEIFLDAFKNKPLFGYGLENMPYAFFQHFKPKLFHYEESIFDRPHNKYIEILASVGLIGFVLWFIFLIFSFVWILRSNESVGFKAGLIGCFFAYLVQNFTLFDIQASYLVFFFSLSLATTKSNLIFKTKLQHQRPILVLLALISISMLIIHFQHWYIVKEIINNLRKPPSEASKGFYNLEKIAGPFRTELGNMIINYFGNLINQKVAVDANDVTTLFIALENAYLKDPLDIRLANGYLNILAKIIFAKKEAGIDYFNDLKLFKENSEKILTQFSNSPNPWIDIISFYITMKEYEKANEILTQLQNKFIYGFNTTRTFGIFSYYVKNYKLASLFFKRYLSYLSNPGINQLTDESMIVPILTSFLEEKDWSSAELTLKFSKKILQKNSELRQNIEKLLINYKAPFKLDLTNN